MTRARTSSLFCTSGRRYTSRVVAERVLWAMRINRRAYADGLRVVWCGDCQAWHLRR